MVAAILAAGGSRLQNHLLADGDDPLVLEKLRSCGSSERVAFKAATEEVDAQVAELILGWQRWLVALSDVIHDRPFVVQG